MPVTRIRESISTTVTTDGDGLGYVTRKINLPDNQRYNMNAIDVFQDNVLMPIKIPDTGPSPVGYQIYVSPYPVQVTDRVWGPSPTTAIPFAGPDAGTDGILYKEVGLTTLAQLNNQEDRYWRDQFPKDPLAANLDMTWFSNHLYVTVIIYNQPSTPIELALSLYVELKAKKSSMITLTMGRYQEFLSAQCRLLTDMGDMTPPNRVRGNTFPSWKFGGIRPEIMVTPATALVYYNRQASNAAQDMLDTGTLQQNFKNAVTMVAFDEGFGDVAGNYPDWLQIFNAAGITSGLIRPYPPPLKFADNGNTLML